MPAGSRHTSAPGICMNEAVYEDGSLPHLLTVLLLLCLCCCCFHLRCCRHCTLVTCCCCRVEVQLVGDRKNTRVEQRILHLDVAAPALKLVRQTDLFFAAQVSYVWTVCAAKMKETAAAPLCNSCCIPAVVCALFCCAALLCDQGAAAMHYRLPESPPMHCCCSIALAVTVQRVPLPCSKQTEVCLPAQRSLPFPCRHSWQQLSWGLCTACYLFSNLTFRTDNIRVMLHSALRPTVHCCPV